MKSVKPRRGESVRAEEERLMSSATPALERDQILAYEFRSDFLLVSSLGRKLASRNPDKIVVVSYEALGGRAYVYVRSESHDLSQALKRIRELGYNAGVRRRCSPCRPVRRN